MEFYSIYQALLDFNKAITRKNHLVFLLCDNSELVYKYELDVFEDEINDEYNKLIVFKIVDTLLYMFGGNTLYIYGSKYITKIVDEYLSNSAYDQSFFSMIYGSLSVKYIDDLSLFDITPSQRSFDISNKGKTIGLDIGGSDIKIACYENDELLFSKEVIWLPKNENNLNYHINMIKSVIDEGIIHLNNDVDNIKISSAGVIKNNQIMIANLFEKVNSLIYKNDINNLYINIIKDYETRLAKRINYHIINDGEVSSIAGINDKNKNVLGIALGTSLASGFVSDKKLHSYLNELSYIPLDISKNAFVCKKTNKKGLSYLYLSQEGVINLSYKYNIDIPKNLTKAQCLKYIQNLVDNNDENAKSVFIEIGMYLAHFIAYVSMFYKFDCVILQGRVMSNISGNILYESLLENLNKLNIKVDIILPNDEDRRLGQAKMVSFIEIN